MQPKDIADVLASEQAATPFLYYIDRESPRLLAHSMPEAALVSDLRASRLGLFLDGPLVRPVAAASGSVLHCADLARAADAAYADATPARKAGATALVAAYAFDWEVYEITLAAWGKETAFWRWNQLSRPGGNVVVQINFARAHAELFHRYLKLETRKAFEYDAHPIRTKGRPTMAWVRLDICL